MRKEKLPTCTIMPEKSIHKIELVITFPKPVTYEQAETEVFDALNKAGMRSTHK